MTSTQPNLLPQAKAGDPKAIAALMNRSLQSKGIVARVSASKGSLQVLLESAQTPDRAAMVAFVRQGITSLGVQNLDRVKVYGRQADMAAPAWSEEFQLVQPEPPADEAAAASPPAESEDSQDAVATSATEEFADSTATSSTPKTAARKTPAPELPPCPPSRLVLAILVSLFAFMPIGVVALIFASQVESKYSQGDYDGAKSASEMAKVMSWISVGIAAPLYLMVGLLVGFVSSNPSVTTMTMQRSREEVEPRNYLGAINRAEQAYHLEYGRFSSSLEELGLGLKPETGNYRYDIQLLDNISAKTSAAAKLPGLRSYTGVVYQINQGDQLTTITQVCVTNFPSPMPPDMPTLVGQSIECPTGSSPLP